jgi:hypothetical protein
LLLALPAQIAGETFHNNSLARSQLFALLENNFSPPQGIRVVVAGGIIKNFSTFNIKHENKVRDFRHITFSVNSADDFGASIAQGIGVVCTRRENTHK